MLAVRMLAARLSRLCVEASATLGAANNECGVKEAGAEAGEDGFKVFLVKKRACGEGIITAEVLVGRVDIEGGEAGVEAKEDGAETVQAGVLCFSRQHKSSVSPKLN